MMMMESSASVPYNESLFRDNYELELGTCDGDKYLSPFPAAGPAWDSTYGHESTRVHMR